nr:hypothetical protein [Tanacetum cinerariifolium]
GGDDEHESDEETGEEDNFDPIPQTLENSEDEGDDEDDQGLNIVKPALNSYAVAADLSKMELRKILIEKIEGNKCIQRSDEQRNLYKALVDAYESDKIILDTYGETVTLKRRRDDDEDKDEEPFAGPD